MGRNLVAAAAVGTVLILSVVLPATANSAVRATVGSAATVTSVSCASPGNCAAGGQFVDSPLGVHAFVLTERNGVWGTAIEVPGLHALNTGGNADISSVSCAPAGGCAAGGYYQDAKSHFHAFVTTEQSGRWSRLVTVFSSKTETFVTIDSLSCPAPGSCVAGGSSPPFVVSEVHGRWRRAILVQAKDRQGNVIVSCVSAGDCTAGWDRFVARERNGRWGPRMTVPGLAALGNGGAAITALSCTSAINCAVGGTYTRLSSGAEEVFVASERHGRWGKAIEVPGFSAMNQEGIGALTSVSCISAGDCVAGGSAAAPAGFDGGVFDPFLSDERNGRWGKAFEVPGIPSPFTNICQPDSGGCAAGDVLSVSCARGGHCAAAGWYDTPAINGQVAFVASYENGRWSKIIQIPGLKPVGTANFSEVNSVSCTPSGSCAAGGENSPGGPMTGPAFVASENNGTWGKAQTVRF